MSSPAASGAGRTDCAIGIDVGGTNVRAGLVRRDGAVIEEHAERHDHRPLEQSVELARSLGAVAEARGCDLAGIGVGVPELVTPDGRVVSTAVLDAASVEVGAALEGIAPTRVDADVRCAAMAEASLGAGAPSSSLLYVSVGTGISSCLVLDGRPWRGERGNALVLGSGGGIDVAESGGEVRTLPVEDVASGPALAHRYSQASGHHLVPAEEAIERVRHGDAIAADTVAVGARVLGARVAQAINLLDPGMVVMGGGLGSAPGPYWSTMSTTVRELIWAEQTRDLPLERARLGPTAGMIGAALLCLTDESG